VRILPSRKPPREQKNEKIEKFEKMLAKHLKFAELLEHWQTERICDQKTISELSAFFFP
jgi:hypothetical protein